MKKQTEKRKPSIKHGKLISQDILDLYKDTIKERECLWCGKKFISFHVGHRKCDECKSKKEYNNE